MLYFDGCPNWQQTDAFLALLGQEIGFDVERRTVETAGDAERLEFRGSPTVLIDGDDPFAVHDEPVGLSCRVYRTDAGFVGAPPEARLRELLETAREHSDDDNPDDTRQ